MTDSIQGRKDLITDFSQTSNHLMSILKIATLNINGITARTRVAMLTDFVRQQETDILFIQEITSTEVLDIQGYNTQYRFLPVRNGNND
jgi:endonuclease/exonuclease/phosphatase family metal-dependent hydrolase